jgi:hypothetical protein
VASLVARHLHLPADRIWTAGAAEPSSQHIGGPHDAVRRGEQLRAGEEPALVVVPTDETVWLGSDTGWTARLVGALCPAATWWVVDAGRKVEDVRRELTAFGSVQALAMFGTQRTASPATVWDLELPISVVDGRAASKGTWLAVLLDALDAVRGLTREPAPCPSF